MTSPWFLMHNCRKFLGVLCDQKPKPPTRKGTAKVPAVILYLLLHTRVWITLYQTRPGQNETQIGENHTNGEYNINTTARINVHFQVKSLRRTVTLQPVLVLDKTNCYRDKNWIIRYSKTNIYGSPGLESCGWVQAAFFR